MSDDEAAAPNLRGTFWKDGFPDDTLPGRFYVNDQRQSKLEMYGAPHVLRRMLDAGVIRILGRLENGKLVTLDNCFATQQEYGSRRDATGTFHVNLAVVGHHFEQGSALAFRGIRFHSDIIDEWLSTDPIRVEHSRDSEKMTMIFDPPPTRSWTLADGTVVTLDLLWSAPGMPTLRNFELRTRTSVSLLFKEDKPINDLLAFIAMFNAFVETVTDQPIVADTIHAFTPGARDAPDTGIGAQIYVQPNIVAESSSSSVHPPFSLFKFAFIADRFATLLEHWFKHFVIHEAPVGLFFSTRSGRDLFLANRFLMLMQALEGFHRRAFNKRQFPEAEYQELSAILRQAVPGKFKGWLQPRLDYGNEPSLRQRLRDLFVGMEPVFGDKETISRRIAELVETRNLLTHYEQNTAVPSGRRLYQFSIVAEMLFYVHLISLLGFPLTEAVKLYTDSQIFARRALYLRNRS